MKNVAVFRSGYLSVSETFISSQMKCLRRYRPIPFCDYIVDSDHKLPIQPITTPKSRLARRIFLRFGYAPRLYQAFKALGVSFVHCHFLTDATLILPFLRYYRIPLVVTAHGYDATLDDSAWASTWIGRRYLRYKPELAEYASAIVCVSDFIRTELVKKGYPTTKLKTIHLGVETEAFRPVEFEKRRGIAFVGRLVEKKGAGYLLDAYARLPLEIREKHPLSILGGGPLLGALQEDANRREIHVNFLGEQSHETALRVIQESRVFCFPSTRARNGDAEGMGIVLMEALASGTPVVIFDQQPMAALLKAEDAGIVVSDRDTNGLAAALQHALSDDIEARRLSSVGPKFCQRHFSLSENTAELERLFGQVDEQPLRPRRAPFF